MFSRIPTAGHQDQGLSFVLPFSKPIAHPPLSLLPSKSAKIPHLHQYSNSASIQRLAPFVAIFPPIPFAPYHYTVAIHCHPPKISNTLDNCIFLINPHTILHDQSRPLNHPPPSF